MALLAIALGPITKTIAVFFGVLLLSWGNQRRAPPGGRYRSNRLGAIHRAQQTARAEKPAAAAHGQPPPIRGVARTLPIVSQENRTLTALLV
jgi:hypothetical protein